MVESYPVGNIKKTGFIEFPGLYKFKSMTNECRKQQGFASALDTQPPAIIGVIKYAIVISTSLLNQRGTYAPTPQYVTKDIFLPEKFLKRKIIADIREILQLPADLFSWQFAFFLPSDRGRASLRCIFPPYDSPQHKRHQKPAQA